MAARGRPGEEEMDVAQRAIDRGALKLADTLPRQVKLIQKDTDVEGLCDNNMLQNAEHGTEPVAGDAGLTNVSLELLEILAGKQGGQLLAFGEVGLPGAAQFLEHCLPHVLCLETPDDLPSPAEQPLARGDSAALVRLPPAPAAAARERGGGGRG